MIGGGIEGETERGKERGKKGNAESVRERYGGLDNGRVRGRN